MLIETDRYNGSLSVYECDRCKTRMARSEMWQVSTGKSGKSMKLLCHLCEKCHRALVRGIFKKWFFHNY